MASLQPHYTFLNKLASRKVLIMGGTSGIGLALARGSLEHGASVIITGSTPASVSAALETLRHAYPEIEPSRITGIDVNLGKPATSEAQIIRMLDFAVQAGEFEGPLYHIAFLAGDVFDLVPLEEISAEKIQMIQQVRYTSAAFLAKHILCGSYMINSSEASLTLTAGTGASKPFGKGWTLAAGMGASMEGMVRGLAIDLAPRRVNLAILGVVRTNMMAKRYGEAAIVAMAKQTLLQKAATPEDAAEVYLYCMKNNFVTAQNLAHDGGRMLI